MTTVTLRREDWELIQEVLNHAIERLDYIQLIPGGLKSDWAIKIINLALSIKPVEEGVEFPDKVMGFTIPEIKKIIDFYRIKTGLDSPVKSEEKKCEHDKGNFWKENGNKHNLMTDKADGKKCPFCPKPEERSPEEIAKNLVDRIKFEINTMSEMGGHGGSNKLATMHFYECVERLSADAIKAERNRGGGEMNCEHKFVYRGIVYENDPNPMSGTGARRRYYFEQFFCEKCLTKKDNRLPMQENDNTYYDVKYGATPKVS